MSYEYRNPLETVAHFICEKLGVALPSNAADGLDLTVEDFRFTIEPNLSGSEVVLSCIVTRLADLPSFDQLTEMVEANFMWAATAGATLGLNRRTGDVLLARSWPLVGLNHVAFYDEMQRMLSTADFWKSRLHGTAATPASEPGASGGSAFFISA